MEQFNDSPAASKFNPPRLALFTPEAELTPQLTPFAGANLRPAAGTVKRAIRKPERKKRPADSPPWLHPSGRWCRKIGKRFFYFGRDEEKALEEWDRVKKYILTGEEPPPVEFSEETEGRPGNPTLRRLCNAFEDLKERLVATGELGLKTQANYRESTDALIAFFGKHRLAGSLTAKDFEDFRASLAKGRGAVSLRGHILKVRMVFKHGCENGLLANPARFGQGFKIPGTVL